VSAAERIVPHSVGELCELLERMSESAAATYAGYDLTDPAKVSRRSYHEGRWDAFGVALHYAQQRRVILATEAERASP
jgi:hypothetical protein